MINLFRNYYKLTKPGIIYGNLITAAAGFLLASSGHINFNLLLETLSGVALVIGSACVFNNFLDREIDATMSRTKNRALVVGSISTNSALIFGSILGLTGFLILYFYTNLTTVILGAIAIFVYVVIYGITKRKSVHGTLVGSVAGALPPAAGYTAATGNFDTAAFLLFLILVFWQMPHFYAIAIYRIEDYKNAKIPVLPIKKGLLATKVQILLYILAFLAAALLLAASYTYIIVMFVVGLVWIWYAAAGFRTKNETRWARKLFQFSLIVLLIFSGLISLNVVFPF